MRLRNVVATVFDFRAARPTRASPRGEPADGPWSTRSLADLTWLSSRPTRNALRPTPLAEIFFTDTAHGRRLWLQSFVVTAFGSHGTRPARASPRGEPADGPRKTRALAGLAWLSSRQTSDTLHPTLLAEAIITDTAQGRRLRLRNVVATAFDSRGAQPARGSPREEPADGPRSTHALADLA